MGTWSRQLWEQWANPWLCQEDVMQNGIRMGQQHSAYVGVGVLNSCLHPVKELQALAGGFR